LPNTILAAVIMVAVMGLIDLDYPIALYRNRKDEFLLLAATFTLTLTIGIKEGILLGVLSSLLLLVYRTSKPHLAILGRIKGTDYFKNIDRFADDVERNEKVIIVRFDSQLYFGNKDYFKREVLRIIERSTAMPEAIIIKAEPINYIDSSAMFMLESLIEELKHRGIKVLFSNVIGPTRDIIQKTGLLENIGKQHFFVNTIDAYNYVLNSRPSNEIQRKISLQAL